MWKSSIIDHPADVVDEEDPVTHLVFFRFDDESSVGGGPSRAAPFGRALGAIVCCDPARVLEEDDGALGDDAGALDGVGPLDFDCEVPVSVPVFFASLLGAGTFAASPLPCRVPSVSPLLSKACWRSEVAMFGARCLILYVSPLSASPIAFERV